MIYPSSAQFITSAANIAGAPEFAMSEVAFLGRSNVGKSSLINALTGRKNLAKSSSTPGKTQLINFFEVKFKQKLAADSDDSQAKMPPDLASKGALNSDANYARDFADAAASERNLKQDSILNLKSASADFESDRHADLAAGLASNSAQSSELNFTGRSALNLADNPAFSDLASLGENISLIFVDLPGFGYAKVSKKLHYIWQKNLDEFIKERLNIKLFVHLIDARQFDLEIDKNLQNYLSSFLRGDQKVVRLYTKADKLNQSERAKLLRHDPQAILVSTLKGSGLAKAREIIVRRAFGL
ncbi:ribosome biogenesis GTP-binding protein YsxC/EngB [Campylobacter gracilis]|uniref:Probable GTP-binding protein EngB n=1 Tax=Campylobacter gracilis RM3268 TaxID=553220 RepID=C8PE09_9BACT|nr:GTP-binding protein [Campylobacter gracilis]AKT92757.1 ribosome biogenesis GTP-binding protein YsxC/EngB [Campylobacter gracilis]EEV18882.1 ribosome biogenesis GTP-binding protein YsxC [Campylobacter gracilis RM3268]UEB45070.1 GTP-binding protein [Campylobacter gracilis]SUW82272.1 GTP-binding protein [Campylobacter gracilis]